ncbi:glycosyltransferase [Polaribacter sp. Z022]|uniref:glycosyltransferase n=1 Tax=Polaribacter sp. Z022 TaxID=2927125 RepID=UPI002020AC12|nr:glycosyltransferase [Polaribacter sp. Z022]MCL7752805.1 glycosyltransferase [Polaribacter sp. Z022]
MKIALVHDWFYTNGGAEKVVHSISNIWDDLDYYSLIDFLNKKDREFIVKGKKVNTSFIQRLPTAKKNHRKFLQFFPKAIESFNLNNYDLVISSSSSIAKGVLTNQNQLHICYCHSPMRYAWNLYHEYLEDKKLRTGLKGWYAKNVLFNLRTWDFISNNRVDHFVANSKYIAERIKKIYNREATVIYPPVDINSFQLEANKENYYVAASRLVSYKKILLIVEAFNKMPNKKLKVIGDGPEMSKIVNTANNNIEILGKTSQKVMLNVLQKARALVFAADEDFGILPVEAQSCGTPVIAFNKGGLRETVIDNETGVFFQKQSAPDIIEAVTKFETMKFDPKIIRKNAERFSKERFEKEFKEFVQQKVKDF